MKDVGLVTLHGMGDVDTRYYADLEEGLRERLGADWARVSFQNVQYAHVLQRPQNQLWQDMRSDEENDLDYLKLRKFFLFGFGDAGSLQYSAHNDQRKYIRVQQQIQSALRKVLLDFGGDGRKPLVIIAHSLGCQVISNYLWDAGRGRYIFSNTDGMDQNELRFLKLASLRNLVTTGCNIPLFISGISPRKTFRKPNPNFRWDNYYDPDDVLGWPLRQLGSAFSYINDHDINVGGFMTNWNPFSHSYYWSDSDVHKAVARILRGLLA